MDGARLHDDVLCRSGLLVGGHVVGDASQQIDGAFGHVDGLGEGQPEAVLERGSHAEAWPSSQSETDVLGGNGQR